MTSRWPLLIFRSLGQRSRSRWLNTVKWFLATTTNTNTTTTTKNVFTQWLPLQLTAHMGGMHVLQTALVDILDRFENGPGQWKNMAARGWCSFIYMHIVKTCKPSTSHIFGPMFMKFGQNICFLDTRVEFENGSKSGSREQSRAIMSLLLITCFCKWLSTERSKSFNIGCFETLPCYKH